MRPTLLSILPSHSSAPFMPLFEDTFTGSAGPLTSHSPDTAPAGFAWVPAGVLTVPDLDGSGNLVNTAGDSSGITSGGIWTPASLTFPFRVELDATLVAGSVALFSELTSFFFSDAADSPSSEFELGLAASAPGVYYISAQGGFTTTTATVSALGAHTYAAVVTATGLKLYADDVEVAPSVQDMSAFTSFGASAILLDTTGPLGHSIQRIALKTQ
jgi:hypothetical protein